MKNRPVEITYINEYVVVGIYLFIYLGVKEMEVRWKLHHRSETMSFSAMRRRSLDGRSDYSFSGFVNTLVD